MKIKLFLLSAIFLGFFALFSYTVAKETYQKFDFDTTVKLQDHIPMKYDYLFSYFSLLGSFEITFGFCLILAIFYLLKGKFLGFLSWLVIVPATAAEIFGKLVLFHPGPPFFLHRTITATAFPSFYVHTDFSYPSGHMTRVIFIVTLLIFLFFISRKGFFTRLFLFSALFALAFGMGITRVSLGEHWPSDVIGGALLGMGTGFFASALILSVPKVDF